jgi:hypothetical protein
MPKKYSLRLGIDNTLLGKYTSFEVAKIAIWLF